MEYERALDVESLSIYGALLFFITFLIKERIELKKEIKDIREDVYKEKKEVKSDHDIEVRKLNDKSDHLLKEIYDLHEEKYKVTREVIPLLIKLIDKLNDE